MRLSTTLTTVLATSLTLLSTAVLADQPAHSRTAREKLSFSSEAKRESAQAKPAQSTERPAVQAEARQLPRGHQG